MASQTSPLSHSAQTFLNRHVFPAPATSPSDECPICRETYHTTGEPRTLITNIPGCTHAFYLHCIKLFLIVNAYAAKNCPVCRTPWLPVRGAGAPYSESTASAPQRADHTVARGPIGEPHTATLTSGHSEAGAADDFTLLRVRERTLSIRADTVRVHEALLLRRMTRVTEREMDVAAREVDVGGREAAARASELAVQQLAEYVDEMRLSVARQQVEVMGLIERQREELRRVFGEAGERRG